jgi:CDP-glycerol glycerophosphotransferase
VFFKPNEEKAKICDKVKEFFQIEKECRIILYAPSFRDSKDMSVFTIDPLQTIEVFNQKFGGKHKILIRMHPRLANKSHKIFQYGASVINASHYDDIQELLLAANAMITDYSSCIFDFMLSRKPAFIFATDIETYNNIRGFYYKLEETPFPVAENNETLAQNVKNFDRAKYDAAITEFLKDKGSVEDGKAGARGAKLIKDIMEGKQ